LTRHRRHFIDSHSVVTDRSAGKEALDRLPGDSHPTVDRYYL
jgi:hypothetical protein